MIDVVIPLGSGSSWDNNELRFCLRSIEKYVGDLRKVYIVGIKPWWIKNIEHIEFFEKTDKNKDLNIVEKILKCCEVKDITNDFVFVSDDQIFLKKTRGVKILPLHSGSLTDCINYWKDKRFFN